MAKRPRNIEKGRYYDHAALAFTLKVLEIVITWALDNGWESATSRLIRAEFDNGFWWIGKHAIRIDRPD